jgi:hypothetical protein
MPGDEGTARVAFSTVFARWSWKPLPNCPGRFVLSTAPSRLPPQSVAPDVAIVEHRVAGSRDPVLVARFADGGLISYRRADGTYVHTLNTREGLERKLAQLGLG